MIDFFSDLRDYLGGALGAALPSVLVVFALLYPCCIFLGFFKRRVVKEAFWIILISWIISVFINTIMFNGSPEPLNDGILSMFYAPIIAIPVSIWIRIRKQPAAPS
jgi:hypothetical protein